MAAGTVQFVSANAIQRYRERVSLTVSTQSAVFIRHMVSAGRTRPRPCRWTRINSLPAGRYAYPAARPDTSVVTSRRVVITMLSRTVRKWWSPPPRKRQTAKPSSPYHSRSCSSWQGGKAA